MLLICISILYLVCILYVINMYIVKIIEFKTLYIYYTVLNAQQFQYWDTAPT